LLNNNDNDDSNYDDGDDGDGGDGDDGGIDGYGGDGGGGAQETLDGTCSTLFGLLSQNITDWVTYKKPESYFSQFWRLEVQVQGASMVRLEPSLGCRLLIVYPYGGRMRWLF